MVPKNEVGSKQREADSSAWKLLSTLSCHNNVLYIPPTQHVRHEVKRPYERIPKTKGALFVDMSGEGRRAGYDSDQYGNCTGPSPRGVHDSTAV